MAQNPACAIMTADCPPEEDCRLQPNECWLEPGDGTKPAASCYSYACLTCGGRWTVKWPQVQPIFDRDGHQISQAVYEVCDVDRESFKR